MKKVFYRCSESYSESWTEGKEYECINGKIVTEFGDSFSSAVADKMCWGDLFYAANFQRIEREVFEADGYEWFKHTSGDPMPCDGEASVYLLLATSGMTVKSSDLPCGACCIAWRASKRIVGWRYADSDKPEVQQKEAVMTLSWGYGIADDAAAIKAIQGRQPFGERTNVAMLNRDVSAVEDSSLSPAQRRHWEQMEAKQAAKEQLKHDAAAKALQERAKQLSDAGNAMDRVNQDHGHKLGAMQCTLHGK